MIITKIDFTAFVVLLEHFVDRFLPRPPQPLNQIILHVSLPNRGAQCHYCHSSDGCLRCCDILDLTNTLQMKMHQEWQKRDNQQKLKRKGNGGFGASRLLVQVACCADIAFFGTPKKPTLNKPVTGCHVADALLHHMTIPFPSKLVTCQQQISIPTTLDSPRHSSKRSTALHAGIIVVVVACNSGC